MKKIALIIMILGMITLSNAQIEKKELKLTPEMEEMVITQIKNLPEKDYSEYGITDRSQLMNLHLGKPIPKYRLFNNEKVEDVTIYNVYRMTADGEPLSLKFQNSWIVPVMSDETPLLFRDVTFSDFGGNQIYSGTKNIIEHFRNYEHKDSIIGCVAISFSNFGDLFIIRKENQDIFVQVYDEATGEYFKNEYRFSELINLLKDLKLRQEEARRKHYERLANKSELEMTPEITKMLINDASRLKNWSDESLSLNYDIKDRSQLEHLHLGKPIPLYIFVDENLTFSGKWNVPVMSDGEPLIFTRIKLEDDGQYSLAGGGSNPKLAKIIHNYEHKGLIIGCLDYHPLYYLIIRKDNQDIFVKMYDSTDKNEYSFSDVLNLLKRLKQ